MLHHDELQPLLRQSKVGASAVGVPGCCRPFFNDMCLHLDSLAIALSMAFTLTVGCDKKTDHRVEFAGVPLYGFGHNYSVRHEEGPSTRAVDIATHVSSDWLRNVSGRLTS